MPSISDTGNCCRQFSVPEMGGFNETVGCLSKCLNGHRQFSVSETVGITVYQSVLTAIGSFRFLRWMALLSIKVSISDPEMGGFTETVGVTAY